jgi:uncharacterized protein YbjT (DUF2867 family)
MIGIVGASGTLGRAILRRLDDRGEPVRLFGRDPRALSGLTRGRHEVVRGDLRDDRWDDSLRDVDTLVLAAHGLVPPTRANSPDRVDDRGNRAVVDAARRAGVGRVVLLSAAGADPRSPVRFSAAKGRAEEHLRKSGVDYLIVRPTVFIESHALRLLADPLHRTGRVQMFGRGATPLNWVSAEDVAESVVDALGEPGAWGREVTIGGPDVMSRLDALSIIEARLGVAAKRRHAPRVALRVLRATAGRLNPGLAYLLDLAINEDRPPSGWDTTPPLDRCGSLTVAEVVERWAAGLEPTPS